jgi:hypothetical protein
MGKWENGKEVAKVSAMLARGIIDLRRECSAFKLLSCPSKMDSPFIPFSRRLFTFRLVLLGSKKEGEGERKKRNRSPAGHVSDDPPNVKNKRKMQNKFIKLYLR